jgi:hypothetical protein
LSDALYVAIFINIKLQVEYNSRASIFPPLTCGEFDAKLEIFYVKMVAKSLHVLQLFLAFCIQFDATMAHNMMALMGDPRYTWA